MNDQEFLSLEPDALIDLVIKDLELCESDSRYEINMYRWHEPYREVCYVCLAGVVIAKEFASNQWNKELFPSSFSMQVEDRLMSLDELRRGKIRNFLEEFKWNTASIFKVKGVMSALKFENYSDNKIQFKKWLKLLSVAIKGIKDEKSYSNS